MTCPTFSGLIYRNKQYCIADKKGFKQLPHPRDLFNLKDGMWCSSAGYDCAAIYGFCDDSLCIDSFVWRPAYKGKPKEEVIVDGRRIEPVEIFSTGEILCNGEWHEEISSDGFEYNSVNYPIPYVNGEMLIVTRDYPDKEGEPVKTTRLVLTLKDSKVVAEEPWAPGGNLHGLIDRTSMDYYAGGGYSELLKEGFTKEELRATGKPCPFSLEEEFEYMQKYLEGKS